MNILRKPLFTFAIGSYCFAPTLLPVLAVLLLLPFLMSLGYWQLDRAALKQNLQTTYQTREQADPIDLNKTPKLVYDSLFYPVKVTGTFDNQHQFLLDNKFYNHQVGYQVITPLILANSKQAVLINRGWIPQGVNRAQLPELKPVNGEVTLTGMIATPGDKNFTLGQSSEDNHWPQRIQQITITKMAQATGYQLLPVIILLAPDQAHGFQREWSPMNLKVGVHYGYAFQWFALAATLLIIFLAVNIHKKPSQEVK